MWIGAIVVTIESGATREGIFFTSQRISLFNANKNFSFVPTPVDNFNGRTHTHTRARVLTYVSTIGITKAIFYPFLPFTFVLETNRLFYMVSNMTYKRRKALGSLVKSTRLLPLKNLLSQVVKYMINKMR